MAPSKITNSSNNDNKNNNNCRFTPRTNHSTKSTTTRATSTLILYCISITASSPHHTTLAFSSPRAHYTPLLRRRHVDDDSSHYFTNVVVTARRRQDVTTTRRRHGDSPRSLWRATILPDDYVTSSSPETPQDVGSSSNSSSSVAIRDGVPLFPPRITNELEISEDETDARSQFFQSLREKMGKVEETRVYHPELVSGEVPRLFSNLNYDKSRSSLTHNPGSTLGAASLIAGTAIGAGVLAIPTATISSGLLPSTWALCFAWAYMVASGLMIAELTINRIGQTGKPGVGLLNMYQGILGEGGAAATVGVLAYFFLLYAEMVGFLAQGGG
eukprot:CAMPEP_0172500696 /NCGR_PEP_ID=MMETSP1066-20121228/141987_1 /TAXON_ID=671091 /ORGANISM="Coscinodiscus wailesii, Strain CCMP2513" /LENGTH=328 /DNA_ID=CAMNT_0013275069 /DNA_START=168 /DNA_END=1150 /DNA_ORIENTATION=-